QHLSVFFLCHRSLVPLQLDFMGGWFNSVFTVKAKPLPARFPLSAFIADNLGDAEKAGKIGDRVPSQGHHHLGSFTFGRLIPDGHGCAGFACAVDTVGYKAVLREGP
ncbi:MAG: hypothetical protein AAEJ59_12895, partial [Arenicellales bacterium]